MPTLVHDPGGFVVYVLVSSITPGPNNLMLTAVGVTRGHREALKTGAGVSVGWSLQPAVCGFGLVSQVIEGVSIACLLWLAVKLWRAGKMGAATPLLNFRRGSRATKESLALTAAHRRRGRPSSTLLDR